MINELILASQSVQSLSVLLKAAQGLTNYNEMVSVISEINAKLMEANAVGLASQEKQSLLSNRIAELEKEIANLKDWNRESERYQLHEICSGVYVFSLKPGMEKGEPSHYLCAKCYNESKKYFLQRKNHTLVGIHYYCQNCNSEIIDHSKPKNFPSISVDAGRNIFDDY
jgi:hypothetical protein